MPEWHENSGKRRRPPEASRAASGRRPGFPGHLPQNRTCAVHIRLFGAAGYYPHCRPAYDLADPSGSKSCTGAATSIVTGPGIRNLVPAFGAFGCRGVDRSTSPRPLAPRSDRGLSAVAGNSVSCWSTSLTETAFPPPRRRGSRVPPGFPWSPVLRSLPTSAGPSAFVLAFYGLPPARNPADLSG
jgi:hypothetical protein